MNVEWTANAIRQLNGIYEYIAKDSEFYASRIVDRLTSRSIQIQEHALSGEIQCSLKLVFQAVYVRSIILPIEKS